MIENKTSLLLAAFDVLRIVIPSLATLAAGYIGVKYGLKQVGLQKQLDFIERQLRYLYSPLVGYVKEVRAKSNLRLRISKVADEAWKEEVAASPQLLRDHDKAFKPFERLIHYDNQQLRQELLPLYRKMLETFREKYYLAEPETTKWYAELSDFVDLWDRWLADSIPVEVIKKLEHSEERLKPFYAELESRHDILRKRLSEATLSKKREDGSAWTDWISTIAAVVIAGCTIFGAIKIENLLNKERIRAIENHATWVEVRPVAFVSKGERDPKDTTSTFWYLEVEAQNLGREPALVRIRDWSFESDKRGSITKQRDYSGGDITLSLLSGKKARWDTSFVMNPDYHIPALISGEDALTIKFRFESQDMAGREAETYVAVWRYTRGEFSLIKDERDYHTSKKEK